MTINSRFSTAIHITTLMAHVSARTTSELIADSVNTNPVVIRRLLSQLNKRGIVESHMGPGGGWNLARNPADISLGDIFRATNERLNIPTPRREPNPACQVGRSVHQVLASHFDDASIAFEASLDETTVADVLSGIGART